MVIEPIVVWALVARGVAVGALAAIAGALWRSRQASMRIAGLLLAASAIAYTLNSSPLTGENLGPADPAVHLFALGGAGFFWLFIVTLFEDRPISPATFAPAGLLTAIGLVGWLARQPINSMVWISHNLIEAGFAIHALLVIVRSWRGDLVETRRRLRGPVLGVVTLYVLLLSALEIGEGLGFSPAAWYDLAEAVALAFMCSLGALAFLRAEPGMFGAVESETQPSDGLDAGDRLLLAKLEERMEAGEAWRREGLTIGALAAEIGAPEHKLRRLINDHLGFRNFAAFVNARRIAAAQRLLSDPARARAPVSAIAFDLGFGSLGPFNRAFKAATGLTPSEWRRQKLAETSPISQNPG